MTDEQLRAAALKSWKSTLIAGGVTAIILGLVLLIWPQQTLLVFASLLGIGLILIGIGRLGNAATVREPLGSSRVLRALLGLIYIIAGIVVLANLHGTLRFLVWVVGVIWVVSGIVEIFSAVGRRRGAGAMTIVIGLLNLAFGLVLLVWPGPTLILLVWISGLWLIALGLLQIIFASTAPKA
jgi:uncharacterized membrane protein HdeD (DUF308 family)